MEKQIQEIRPEEHCFVNIASRIGPFEVKRNLLKLTKHRSVFQGVKKPGKARI